MHIIVLCKDRAFRSEATKLGVDIDEELWILTQ